MPASRSMSQRSGLRVTAIGKVQDDGGPARPKNPGGVSQVLRGDLRIRGEQIRKGVHREHQIERPVAEAGEITPAALLEATFARSRQRRRASSIIPAPWISLAERLGPGSVADHSPFGERDFAGRWSRLLSPQASTGGKSG
jgi:hypothetical protein